MSNGVNRALEFSKMLVTMGPGSQDSGRGGLGEVRERLMGAKDQQEGSGIIEPEVPPTEKECC